MKAQMLRKYDDKMRSKERLAEEKVADPKIEKSTDMIVRIGDAGVCRTDLHIIEGVWRPHTDPAADHLPPIIVDHENAGWIEEVGDPVIVHPMITDGTCLARRRGFDLHGPDKFPGLDCNGGCAEFLCTSERNIAPLPKTHQPKEVAP
jgi:NAD+-dependent secondary alcohol dehydrogenase Adh1